MKKTFTMEHWSLPVALCLVMACLSLTSEARIKIYRARDYGGGGSGGGGDGGGYVGLYELPGWAVALFYIGGAVILTLLTYLGYLLRCYLDRVRKEKEDQSNHNVQLKTIQPNQNSQVSAEHPYSHYFGGITADGNHGIKVQPWQSCRHPDSYL